MEEPACDAICIRRFLQEFDHAIGEDVQLRGGIVGSYSLPPEDVEGEVTDWALQYLEQRKCPYTLAVLLAKTVAQQLGASVHQRVSQSNGSSKEDGTKQLLDSSQLHMETINNLHELCSHWKDRPEIADMSVSCDYEIRHVTSVCAIKNGRRKMEDRHVVLHDLNTFCGLEDAPHHSYYAVFDGHAGVDAASFAAAHLHKNIVNHPAFLTDPETAIRVAFRLTDEQFLDRSSREGIKSGCTAVCTIIREQTLYLAWLGDSQATLIREGNPISIMTPHKPDREDEKHRIKELGGYVIFNGTWRVSGTLAVSRALGDPEYKPFVSSEPDIVKIPFDGTEDFLILACDGLWDRLSPSDASMAVYYHLANFPDDIEDVAVKLVHQAKEQGSSDNITTIVVFLKDLPSLIASAQNYSIHFPQVVQTENRTHSMINGDNHLLECHGNDTVDQAVEKPNILDLSSGFVPHCPQGDYNIGNPFSDFLHTSENGPAGSFRYQPFPKGMAPEATALSELPTPPIDEIIAAQQFEMASSDNNAFSSRDLMNTLDLQDLTQHAVGESHREAKELASEIVNLTIETAVRQVSATPPPDSSLQDQHQEDSDLEEGPLEDLESSPEHALEMQTHNISSMGSGVLSPFAEPFYPASLRSQEQNVTPSLHGLEFSKSMFMEDENIDKSAVCMENIDISEQHSSDVAMMANNASLDSLIPLQCDTSHVEENMHIIPEFGAAASTEIVSDNQIEEPNLLSNSIVFDQEVQKFEEDKVLENSMNMANSPDLKSEPEMDIKMPPDPFTQYSLDVISSCVEESSQIAQEMQTNLENSANLAHSPDLKSEPEMENIEMPLESVTEFSLDVISSCVDDSSQIIQEMQTNQESITSLKQLETQPEYESWDGDVPFQYVKDNSADMLECDESNSIAFELSQEVLRPSPYDAVSDSDALNVESTEQRLESNTLSDDLIITSEESLQKMTEEITDDFMKVDKQFENLYPDILEAPPQTHLLLETSINQDVALAPSLLDTSLAKDMQPPTLLTFQADGINQASTVFQSTFSENIVQVPDVSEIHPLDDTAQVSDMSEIPVMENAAQVPDISEIPLKKDVAEVPDMSDVPVTEDIVEAFMLVEDIVQATKLSEIPFVGDIIKSPMQPETTLADDVQALTLSKSPIASDDIQATMLSGTSLAEEIVQMPVISGSPLVEQVIQTPITSEIPIDLLEVSDIAKKDTSAEESPHLQPIATSSPISSGIQTVDMNEHTPENIDLLEPSLLTESVSSVQKSEMQTSEQLVEPLSSTGAFIPEIQASLLEVTGVPAPADSLVDDIPQGTAAVIEAIPDSVPEAEGVTEDVDSDSEKDGGWSYIKVDASQEPSVAKKPEPSKTVPPPDGKVSKQPVKSTIKTVKKDTGKSLDIKSKPKSGITEKTKIVSAASHSEKVVDTKEKTSVAKAAGTKALPPQKRQQVAATASVRKVPQLRPATKTNAGLPSITKKPASPIPTSTQPSTETKASCPSVQKEHKQPVSAGPVTTKPPTQRSVPTTKTSSTSRPRTSLTTRPASAPISRCKDVPSSHTPVTKPGSASTRLSSTEAVQKTSKSLATVRQTLPKRPTSTLSTPKPSTLSTPKPSRLSTPKASTLSTSKPSAVSTPKPEERKNGPAPAKDIKETKNVPNNSFKMPSSGAVRKSVPKMETKQTKDNVNKQISAKTPQSVEKTSSAPGRTTLKKLDSAARQTQSTGKLEPKLVPKRPSTGTTPRTSVGKGPIQSKDLKSKQPLKGNQTVRSKPESISEPKKDSIDLHTPDQEKGSLEANNRETTIGDSSGATPETPVSSSVTSSVSEEQTAMKAESEEIPLDTTTATHIEGSQH